jgi:alpha-L-rhamnosidase
VDDDGRGTGDTQAGYLLALSMNLVPDGLRSRAADHPVADIAAHGWHLTTGFLGVGMLAPTLTVAGRTDVAYRLLLTDTFPSWGYSIRHGVTTIWERWDGWTADSGFQSPIMNSFNHYSLGAIGEWLYRTVGGIDRDRSAPGWRQLVLQPEPGGDLTWARTTYDSPVGRIETHWRRLDDRFELDVVVPASAGAVVHLPRTDGGAALEGGRPLEESADVRVVEHGPHATVLRVGSGTYRFEVRNAPLPTRT